MSTGWHAQRRRENAAFRTQKPEVKSLSLEEEIASLERQAAVCRVGGLAHTQVRRKLDAAYKRREVRAALNALDKL